VTCTAVACLKVENNYIYRTTRLQGAMLAMRCGVVVWCGVVWGWMECTGAVCVTAPLITPGLRGGGVRGRGVSAFVIVICIFRAYRIHGTK
jgi:hypothetical protein